ncbi:hypothetical protein BGX38DRAFT_765 [Terfezia claveryi]|nr:hypothetical protein BGX38DRAFT_765 [Terfezia claveryi]
MAFSMPNPSHGIAGGEPKGIKRYPNGNKQFFLTLQDHQLYSIISTILRSWRLYLACRWWRTRRWGSRTLMCLSSNGSIHYLEPGTEIIFLSFIARLVTKMGFGRFNRQKLAAESYHTLWPLAQETESPGIENLTHTSKAYIDSERSYRQRKEL